MTSPPVEVQLVLELESRVLGAECVDVFPYGQGRRLSFPLDQHLTNASGQTVALSALRLRRDGAMVHLR